MTRHLFIDNQDSTWLTGDSSAYLYEQRCVPLASNSDIVVLSTHPDPKLPEYLTMVGIAPPEIRVVSERRGDLATSVLADRRLLEYLQTVTRERNWIIEPFLWGPSFCQLVDILGVPVNSDFRLFSTFAGKNRFRQLAQQLQLRIPDGVTLSGEAGERELRDFLQHHQQVVVKKDQSIGSNGITIVREASPEKIIQVLSHTPQDTYVLEQLVDPFKEGSVHLIFRGGSYEILVAETFYKHLAYDGFIFPGLREYTKEIESQVQRLASYFVQKYNPRGSYGLDFLIDRHGQLIFLELNPRLTAVTYALEFARRVLGSEFEHREIAARVIRVPRLKGLTLDRIIQELTPLLYILGKTRTGILLHNVGLTRIGAIEIIAVSTVGESVYILDRVEGILT